MPTTEQLRNRLLDKLRELFQLNQPDLDFGFYRVMHAKAQEIEAFLDQDLLKIVDEAFGDTEVDRLAELKATVDREIETAKDYGVDKPEEAPRVKEAQAAYDAAKESGSAEAEVFDHLYRFFERYYDSGDFVSRRYLTRETEGQAAPYAVPYNGEEVKLHWANADQYYIKTSEAFSHFTVDLMQASEIRDQHGDLFRGAEPEETEPKRVHFKVVEASEGAHGNVKESDKRFFILHAEAPIGWNAAGELELNFEYRPDPDKTGQDASWRKKRNDEAVAGILEALKDSGDSGEAYLSLLQTPAPTEKEKTRPLLAKYLNKYTARNTMDYFIHKDLGGFLKRELDFYIKNEVMRLDDLDSAEAPAVEAYLARIKVLRRIACKLIDFLSQLEDFQKKLWLKKKFVVETNYCITLDRIPEELYPEIAANEAQRAEWVKLFAIDEVKGDLGREGYSEPLTEEFLKQNDKLVLDTAFFDPIFVAQLLEGIEDLDGQCDGLLLHSDNFQGLNFINEKKKSQFNCVYIDPPYNTSDNAFLYKNLYKHSSWLSMIQNGLGIVPSVMTGSGVLMGAIDDTEYSSFKSVLQNAFRHENYLGTVAVEVNPAGQNIRPNVPARSHDYFHIFAKNIDAVRMLPRQLTDSEAASYKEKDELGHFYWDNLRRRGGNSRPTDRPKQWFPLYVKGSAVRVAEMRWDNSKKEWQVTEKPPNDWDEVWPIDPKGEKRIWRNNPEGAKSAISKGEIGVIEKAGRIEVSKKSRQPEGKKPKTLWSESKYSATSHGTKYLLDILGPGFHFSYPKSIHLVEDAISYWAKNSDEILDFFAGSGTTADATIRLCKRDVGRRKYTLIEVGNYFDTALKPRIAKVVYSSDWKNGKPISRDTGISHCFKYIRLESYEDTLNNLAFEQDEARKRVLDGNPALKEDYMLRYLLDVETRGSASLLNIDAFSDPSAYTLKVKKPGSEEQTVRKVDLIETFNFLIGLRVEHLAAPQTFSANFNREPDPELPEDQNTRLVATGLTEIRDRDPEQGEETFWFRKVEGWIPKDPSILDADTRSKVQENKERILVVWRNLTGDLEKDNAVLDEWFRKNRISTQDFEFDTIYVNGSNNLPNLKQEGDNWKVRLIEEEFHKRMWEVEG